MRNSIKNMSMYKRYSWVLKLDKGEAFYEVAKLPEWAKKVYTKYTVFILSWKWRTGQQRTWKLALVITEYRFLNKMYSSSCGNLVKVFLYAATKSWNFCPVTRSYTQRVCSTHSVENSMHSIKKECNQISKG